MSRDVLATTRILLDGVGGPNGSNSTGASYGNSVRDLVRGRDYLPAIEFVIALARTVPGLSNELRRTWFTAKTDGNRRGGLHGWRLWQTFYAENHYAVLTTRSYLNPPILLADFIRNITANGVSEHMKVEAKPAVIELFSILRNDANFKDNKFLRNVSRSLASHVKKQSKYRDIWDLSILLNYIRKGPDTDRLCWNDLMARAAAIFMVFIPLCPVGMWRINPNAEKQAEGVQSIEVFIRKKWAI
jgi:hypothetical protein